MDKKIKLLVIGLGALAAISLLIAFQLNITSSKLRVRKEAIERELAQLGKENEKLAQDLSSALGKNKSLVSSLDEAEAKGRSLQEEANRIKERLDLTSKERDSLLDKIQTLIDDKRKLQESLDTEKTKKAKKDNGKETEKAVMASDYVPTSSQEAFWAEVLRQKADAELELEGIKTQLKEIAFRADELQKEKGALEMEVKNINQLKEDSERRASYNEKLANALSEDLVREKNDKEALVTQLGQLREDSRQMRARIKDLEGTKSTLYKKIDNLEQERMALTNKLGQTESNLSGRVNEIVKIKKDLEDFQSKEMPAVVPGSRTVELSPIIVHGKQDVDKPALTGRVLSINKQNKFIVIDLGESSGVKLNDKFNVYRDNKYIATVETIQLRREITAADIKDSAAGQEIKVGDIVKLVN